MAEFKDINRELLEARNKIAALEHKLSEMLQMNIPSAGFKDSLPDHQLSSEGQIKYFVRHLPVSVAMFDKNMNYMMVSDKYIRDYKMEDVDMIGKCHYDLFPHVPQRWKDAHSRCLKGVVEACEEDLLQTSKDKIFIDWVVSPWYDGNDKIGGLILFAEIVNERVEGKHKMLKLHSDLRQSFQQLEEFAFAVSHTLQDPLQSTLSFVNKIGEFLIENGFSSQKEDADYLEVNVRRMQRMLDGLLEFAMVGNRQGHHLVSLGKVVRSVMDNLMYRIRERNVKITFDRLPSVEANEFEMITIFQNLIGNAIKYNSAEEVVIDITSERKEDFWEIKVADNGDGIPQSIQSMLFKLERDLDKSSHYQATGVGLPICKNIIEGFGGKIWFESTLNEGSQFYFTIKA